MRTEIHFTGKESKMFDNGGEQITILDGKMKYKFSTTKKDGAETKAYEGWKKLNAKIGDILPVEVNEEEKSFQDQKTGKTVNYTDRRIMYFYTDPKDMARANMSSTSPDIQIDIAPDVDVTERLNGLEKRIEFLEEHLYPEDKKKQEPEDEIKLETVPF